MPAINGISLSKCNTCFYKNMKHLVPNIPKQRPNLFVTINLLNDIIFIINTSLKLIKSSLINYKSRKRKTRTNSPFSINGVDSAICCITQRRREGGGGGAISC